MDEMDIISTECLNALYEITHPQKNILVFGKAGIGKPTVVQNFIDQRNEQKDYFKNKYHFIKYVEKYIDLLIDYNIPSKKIDKCLYLIAYDVDPIFIQVLLGEHICNKIIELKKETPYEYGKHAIKGGE